MTESFKMPDPGEGIHEVEITELHIDSGDRISDGDKLFSIESDKAAVDVPAPFDGRVEDIRVSEGDRVNVGDVVLTYRPDGDRGEDDDAETKRGNKQRKKKKKAKKAGSRSSRGPSETKERSETGREKPSERRAEASSDDEEPESREDRSGERSESGTVAVPVRATPSTRRLARDLGIDLGSVEGTGEHGRVLAKDVRALAGEPPPDRPPREREKQPPEIERAEPAAAERGIEKRVKLRGIRLETARRMSKAWAEIPHVTHQDMADITQLERFRQTHKIHAEREGGKLTITVLVAKALASALRAHPRFNATLDTNEEELIVKQSCNIGFAIDTEEGLLVPVVRDADRKSILEISVELKNLSDRARAGELKPRELSGGTITVTNPGTLGGTGFTPIINPPQVAILGLGKARVMPTVAGDVVDYDIVPRLMLPIALGFDHRANDGADAARLVSRIAETLAEPEAFTLQI